MNACYKKASLYVFMYVHYLTPCTGPVKQWWWRILTCVCGIVIIFQLTKQTTQYFRYDVNINRNIVHSNQLTFPAVTACSMCPVSRTALLENPSLLERLLSIGNHEESKARSKRSIQSWIDFDGNLYSFTTGVTVTHANAKNSCESEGSHLLYIETDKENEFILEERSKLPLTNYYIGLYGFGLPNLLTMKWDDGTDLTFENWGESASKTGNNNGCGFVSAWGIGLWSDVSCDFELNGYICEKADVSVDIATTTQTTAAAIVPTTDTATTSGTTLTEKTSPNDNPTSPPATSTTTTTTAKPTTQILTDTKSPSDATTNPEMHSTSATSTATPTVEPITETPSDTTSLSDATTSTLITVTTATHTERSMEETTIVDELKTRSTLSSETVPSSNARTASPIATNTPAAVVTDTANLTDDATTLLTATVKSIQTENTSSQSNTRAIKRSSTSEAWETLKYSHSTPTLTSDNSQVTSATNPTTAYPTMESSPQIVTQISTVHKYWTCKCCQDAWCSRSSLLEAMQCACNNSQSVVNYDASSVPKTTLDGTEYRYSSTVSKRNAPTSTTRSSTTSTNSVSFTQPAQKIFSDSNDTASRMLSSIEDTNLMEMIADWSIEEKRTIGIAFDDIILDCRYAGRHCMASEFVHTYNPVHGNCYTFNSGKNSSVEMAHVPGRRHGLHMIFDGLTSECMGSTAARSPGPRVVVHHQDRMPFPEMEGVTAGPGHAYTISLKTLLHARLGDHFRECSKNNREINMYSEWFGVKYSQQACQFSCYQRHVIEYCSCFDPSYLPPKKSTAIACGSLNDTQAKCIENTAELFAKNKVKCDCPQPCWEVRYDTLVTLGLWPSAVYRAKIEQLTSSARQRYVDDMTKTEIYFEDLNWHSYTQSPSYTVDKWLSHVGGTFGLWLGCSVFTIIETLELIYDLIIFVLIRLKK